MKFLISILATTIILAGCQSPQDNGFVITGEMEGLQDGISVGLIEAESMGSEVIAETVVKDGKFVLTGSLEHPKLCTLTTNNLGLLSEEEMATAEKVHWTYTPVFVSNTEMVIKADNYNDIPTDGYNDKFTIEGGQPQADYMEYLKLKSQSTDESGCVDWDYIKNNPKSVVSCYLANEFLQQGYTLSADSLAFLTSTITEVPDDTVRFNEFKRLCSLAKATVKGNPVVDLKMKDTEGNDCTLSSVIPKGKKAVLVDFWASWCGICRAATPDFIALQKELGDDIAIIGVSTDEDNVKWREAMKKDGATWPQYILTDSARNDFFEKYRVVGVPYYLIIDTNGNVVKSPDGSVNAISLIKAMAGK